MLKLIERRLIGPMDHTRYTIKLDFEAIKIPPVTDILVLGSDYRHGKLGIFESFKFLVPDEFEFYDYDNEKYPNISSIAINKKLLKKINLKRIFKVLEDNVFSHVDEEEAININFSVKYYVDNIDLGV